MIDLHNTKLRTQWSPDPQITASPGDRSGYQAAVPYEWIGPTRFGARSPIHFHLEFSEMENGAVRTCGPSLERQTVGGSVHGRHSDPNNPQPQPREPHEFRAELGNYKAFGSCVRPSTIVDPSAVNDLCDLTVAELAEHVCALTQVQSLRSNTPRHTKCFANLLQFMKPCQYTGAAIARRSTGEPRRHVQLARSHGTDCASVTVNQDPSSAQWMPRSGSTARASAPIAIQPCDFTFRQSCSPQYR